MRVPFLNFKKLLLISIVWVALITFVIYGGYSYWELRKENVSDQKTITELQKEIAGLEDSLVSTHSDLSRVEQVLEAEQNKNGSFEAQIKDISGTVGTLQKLSKTDPELLKKYSKVYFLSENYVPAQLSAINAQYIYDKNKPQLIHSGVLPYLEGMFVAASRDSADLQVVSAYRSFYEQVSVKSGYKVTYGAGTANQFSADQGYSEHQLGTAVDFTTPEASSAFSKFEATKGYKWLTENAYKFGFVLSYPKDNIYYQFEPWHWRFVGILLAIKLHNEKEYFYNLSQRDIDEYLVSFFE